MKIKYILGQLGENGKPRTIVVEDGTTLTMSHQPNKSNEEIVDEVLKHSPLKAFFEDETYQSIDVYADTKERILQALQAKDAERELAIAATEIRVREEEANEYNKIIEKAVEEIKEALKANIPDGENVKVGGIKMNDAGVAGWNQLRYALLQNFDHFITPPRG